MYMKTMLLYKVFCPKFAKWGPPESEEDEEERRDNEYTVQSTRYTVHEYKGYRNLQPNDLKEGGQRHHQTDQTETN